MKNYLGPAMAIGLVFGVAIGIAMHQLATGIAVGVIFGIALGQTRRKKSRHLPYPPATPDD